MINEITVTVKFTRQPNGAVLYTLENTPELPNEPNDPLVFTTNFMIHGFIAVFEVFRETAQGGHACRDTSQMHPRHGN